MSSSTLRKAIVPILLIITITIVACYFILNEYGNKNPSAAIQKPQQEEPVEEAPEVVEKDKLQYTITAVLTGVDAENMVISVLPVESGNEFNLSYDGTTTFYARHGNSITISQLQLGEVVDVTYSVHSGILRSVQISDNAWTMTGVTRFEINEKRKSMTIADDTYKIGPDLVVSYGDRLQELMDVTQMDSLTVKGIDRKIISVIVERGHGYIRLANDAYFVGGWIEVGQEIIKPITSEMLLPVPEGTYHVKVTNRGYAGEEDLVIERDKENVLDLDKIEIEEVAIGHIEFVIEPEYAQLYVDKEMTDFTDRVPLEYGIHSVHVEAAGYKSVDTNIRIASEFANVEISLELDEEDMSSSSTNKYAPPSITGTSSTASSTLSAPIQTSSSSPVVVSETNQIYVEAPVGAEVYLDGNYFGIAPAHTNKVTGQHVLTLSKDGYATKSYTINVDNEDRDVTFSFSDLVESNEQ